MENVLEEEEHPPPPQLSLRHAFGHTDIKSDWMQFHDILLLVNNSLTDHHLLHHLFTLFPTSQAPGGFVYVFQWLTSFKCQAVLETSMEHNKAIIRNQGHRLEKESLVWGNVNSKWEQRAWALKKFVRSPSRNRLKKPSFPRLALSPHFIHHSQSSLSLSLSFPYHHQQHPPCQPAHSQTQHPFCNGHLYQ